MRLTKLLRYAQGTRRGRAEKYEFLSREMWRNKAKFMNVKVPRLRPEVAARVEQLQPEDMFTSDRYEREIRAATVADLDWTPPDDSGHLWRHPRQQEQPGRVFRWQRRFERAEAQAAALTNTDIRRQLPPQLLAAAEAATLTDTDVEMLERSVMRSHYWHPEESRHPRRFDPAAPAHRYPADFGVSVASAVRFLFADWFRWAALARRADGRQLLRDSFLETAFHCRGVAVHLQELRHFNLVADWPLPPLAAGADARAAADSPLPSLYPLSPLVDIPDTLQYDTDVSDAGLAGAGQRSHLLAVGLPLPNLWCNFDEPESRPVTLEQRTAIAVVNCFGQALAQAKAGQALPVTTLAVCSDGVHFDFACYQLNSLGADGARNVAWVDAGSRLFRRQVPRRGPLRDATNSELQPLVFQKFLALHQFGAP